MSFKRNENIKFIRLNSIEDLEVVVGKKVTNIFPMHRHEKYCIGILEKGDAVLVHKNIESRLRQGCVYFINPKETHQIKPVDSQGFDHTVLCFGTEFVNNYFKSPEMGQAALSFKDSIISGDAIWDSILSFSGKLKKANTDINLENELMKVFLEAYQNFSFSRTAEIDEKKKSDGIQKVCQYIMENSKESLSLQEMASIAGLSKFHFLRTFKGEIGISPYDYQTQLKIKYAQKILLEGYPLSYAAVESGFSDQSHFTRFFKRNTGTTPSQFVRMNIKI